MATGPEHYQQAEKLAKVAVGQNIEQAHANAALAQVHATLALAAATALFLPLDAANERRPEDEDAWHKVAGTYTDISGQQQ